jgi:hypothetical protein
MMLYCDCDGRAGDHLATDINARCCCCRRKRLKHPAAWLGIFPYFLPWLRADLHRCVVNLYIFLFLPHFDGLLRLIIWRDYRGETLLAADPSIAWGGEDHAPHLWASSALLANHLLIIVYLMHGAEQIVFQNAFFDTTCSHDFTINYQPRKASRAKQKERLKNMARLFVSASCRRASGDAQPGRCGHWLEEEREINAGAAEEGQEEALSNSYTYSYIGGAAAADGERRH